jgi:hypothetical protein
LDDDSGFEGPEGRQVVAPGREPWEKSPSRASQDIGDNPIWLHARVLQEVPICHSRTLPGKDKSVAIKVDCPCVMLQKGVRKESVDHDAVEVETFAFPAVNEAIKLPLNQRA